MDASTIAWLSGGHPAKALLKGGLKLFLNIHRGWLGKAAPRHPRATIS